MEKIKKLLAVFVCAAMILALVPCVSLAAATSGTCGENLTWTLDGGVFTISGTGDMEDYEYEGYEYAETPWHSYNDSITSVVIGDGATSVGNYAFYGCTSLASVTLPDSLTSIGDSAFYGCTSLTGVTLPDSLTSIDGFAFYGCTSLTDVTLPADLTSLGGYAFYGCTSLTSVTLPAGLGSYGDAMFAGCTSLTSINAAEGSKYFASIDGVLFNKKFTALEQYPAGKSESSYSVPDGVIYVSNCAFRGCTNLTDVTFPDSVTSIGVYAFFDCTGLTSVALPSDVTKISSMMFRGCTSLTSITIPVGVTSIGKRAFFKCSSLTDVYYGGTEEQWNEIEIGEYNDCLTNATIHYSGASVEPEIKAVSATADGDEITVAATVENASSAKAFAVGYGADGTAEAISELADGEATLAADGVKTVKVFVWESIESMRPLCAAKEVAVE